nr:autophagy-related protein 9 [Aspergillus niger CBS 513.88]|eukprot:XP_001390972.2 autophagy-related protein 9 [Aspergillus niger CBS 513.88]
MMTSNILSRFLPPNGSPSVYETIRQHDNHSDASDVEERAGMAFEDEHGDRFSDRELEDALADAGRDDSPGPSEPFLPRSPPTKRDEGGFLKAGSRRRKFSRSGRIHAASPRHKFDDSDDDVPPSLLVEGDQDDDDVLRSKLPPPPRSIDPPNVEPPPRPSPRDDRVHWEAARDRLPLHDTNRRAHHASLWSAGYPNLALVDPKEKALWMWANVENLDNFLKEVYTYFLGNGIWSILLNRVLSLLTFAFVVGFSIFLTNCIDYHKVRGSRTLDDILIQKCTKQMSMDSNPATAGAVSAKHRKFMGSQSKQRMDAHDIANRLMRKENYLIALINKDILDLTLPIPFLRNRQLFSRTLEWNINLCIMDYVFNEQGQVRTLFLKDTHRRALSEGLRRRFMFAGIMNIFVAPFIVVYFMMHYFFRYFNEYKKNPSQIGSRQYTPLAEWKFREFNELWHLFERRVNMSYPFASRYVDQFPKDKMVQFAGFVAFVSGALASVLALASVVDPELFLGFEITHDRTVLFYLGVFGSIWAVAQGLVPEETNVFDPEYALLEVINFTHYFPGHWKGRLHSDDVRKDFAVLYQMKIVIFLEEILSMIFTPFILWFSLPKCSDRLIDFFREFTVHVDGMGYLCSFAVFDFKKGTNVISQGDTGRRDAARQDLRADYFSTKDGKMLASYYGFLDNYGANPRSGHPSTKRQFHPPPTFPTLGSPSAIEMGNFGDRPAAAGLMGQQSTYGAAPRFGPAGMGDHLSPAPSMLLDPHHQPSASGFRSTHRANPYPRYRASRPPPTISDPIEDEDPPAGKGRSAVKSSPGVGSSGGGIGTSDSNLGESWRMNLVGDEVEEEDEGGENVDTLAGGGGVLGLIQQFQKVNQDNRGRTTVGI